MTALEDEVWIEAECTFPLYCLEMSTGDNGMQSTFGTFTGTFTE